MVGLHGTRGDRGRTLPRLLFLFWPKEEPSDLKMRNLAYEVLLLFCKHLDVSVTCSDKVTGHT